MAYKDLRDWIKLVENRAHLVRAEGVSWNLEASAFCNMAGKIVLFDKFPGYPAGYRMLGNMGKGGLPLFFITVNWSTEARKPLELCRSWLARIREFQPVPPAWVKDGPVMENVQTGNEVDLSKFPAPFVSEKDGGRFIGTCDSVIMKDPENGLINLGTYRLQLHDKNTTGFHSSEGKDGRIIMEKYHARGKACPVVVLLGMDAGIFEASTTSFPHRDGSSELDWAGWYKGQPEEVIEGRFTGLPIPANAEIALEGEIPQGILRREGPFCEWTGYSQVKELPIIKVKAVYHRKDPILTCSLDREFYPQQGIRSSFRSSALIWDQMEKAGVRGIHGIAAYNNNRLVVVSIKNLYAGHSMQAGLIASQCRTGALGNTYCIVVDDNIDPFNFQEVMWSVIMTTEPKRSIQILEHLWASHLSIQDPSYVQKADYAMRREKATYISKAIIDACKPLEWDTSWHSEVRINPDMKKQVKEKWGHLLGPSAGE